MYDTIKFPGRGFFERGEKTIYGFPRNLWVYVLFMRQDQISTCRLDSPRMRLP